MKAWPYDASGSGIEEIWEKLKSSLLKADENVCRSAKTISGEKRPGGGMWLSTVQQGKVEMLENEKKGSSKGEYQKAKRLAKHAFYLAKSQAEQKVLHDPSPMSSDLFCLSIQMRREILDVQSGKPVRNDAGELWLDVRARQAA